MAANAYKSKIKKILDILLISGLFVLVFVLSLRRLGDYDLWGHMKAGEYFFKTGSILKTHYFNCSWPDFPYLNHEWLFQAITYSIYTVGGETLLVSLQIILILASFLLLYKTCRLYSDNVFIIVFILSIGVLASSHRFVLRPQHFSYIFLLINLFSLHQYVRGRTGYLYLLPPVMLLWVNIHAESLWGLIVPAIFIVTEAVLTFIKKEKNKNLNKLIFIFISVILMSLINPFTYKTVIWPLLVMSEQFAGVEELFAPTTIRYLPFWLYCGIFIASAFFSIKRIQIHFLIISIFFSVVAWIANRGIPHFIFASAPVIVAATSAFKLESRYQAITMWISRIFLFMRLILFVFVSLIIFSIVTDRHYLKKFDNIPYPEGAVRFIKDKGIKGNMFNHHGWGGYIIWELYPSVRLYIDNRFFHKRFFEEYWKIFLGGTEWKNLLDKYNINIILLDYSSSSDLNLRDQLFRSYDWRLVYWDDYSLLYLKDEASFKKVADKYTMRIVNPDRFKTNGFDKKILISAAEEVKKNIENAGDSWRVKFVFGKIQYLLGDMQGSAVNLEEAIRLSLDPTPEMYFYLGQAYMALGRLSDAERSFKKVVETVPDVQVYEMLWRIYILQGKNREAESLFNQHLKGK